MGEPLRRAGDAYIVRGGRGTTIIAGYPWFTDWGRDTFISMRGLCLAAGRFEESREILLQWAGAVSQGMLPNRFPDGGEPPEYNTVDAALWFVVAVHDYLSLAPPPTDGDGLERWGRDQATLLQTCEQILDGYAAGTRYGIRLDPEDGLLFAGEPGVALTWMDARLSDGTVVTPRVGKPVEIQALWLNALYLMAANSARWRLLYEKARVCFEQRFWNPARGCLFDVVDVNGEPGKNDPSMRPNQIFAVGGLPLVLLPGAWARTTVETVERELLTPGGLRTLGRDEPGYCGRYEGGPTATRRRVPPGHGVAVAAGAVRGGVGARARGWPGGAGRGAGAVRRAVAGGDARGGGFEPSARDHRRGRPVHVAGLPVPGVVGGRGEPVGVGRAEVRAARATVSFNADGAGVARPGARRGRRASGHRCPARGRGCN